MNKLLAALLAFAFAGAVLAQTQPPPAADAPKAEAPAAEKAPAKTTPKKAVKKKSTKAKAKAPAKVEEKKS